MKAFTRLKEQSQIGSKRLRIRKSLQHIKGNTDFVSVMNHLAMSDKDLDAVLEDINNYHISDRKEHQAHSLWLQTNLKDWNEPLALHLTTRYELDADRLAIKYEEFINRLSKRIYKMAYKRYGKRIKNKSYIEGARKHIHGFIETPDFLSKTEIRELINKCWGDVGYAKITRVSDYDAERIAQVEYALKPRTKTLNTRGSYLQDAFIPA